MDGLNEIIQRLESQKAAVEQALEALRGIGGEMSGGFEPADVTGGNKRSAAQRARWAAKRAEAGSSAPANRKGGISAAGRKALAEAMRKRWAAKRTAAAAKKRGRAKKAA